MCQYIAHTTKNRLLYLKDTNEIFNNDPVIVVKLIHSQFQRFVSSDLVNCSPVFENETHHVVGRVPSGYNVTGDELLLEVEF